uniref:Uncharacterized protein n=1 Tax=Vespula pensylvanica TaxID=30213 RepID=A0A834P8K6_VESPE|nr:hypothetical protein H0235_005161 [Vespula pensylvanica]
MLRSEVAKARGGGNGGGKDGGNGTSTEILLSELGELLTETTTGAAERKFMDFVWYLRLDLARALIYDRFEKFVPNENAEGSTSVVRCWQASRVGRQIKGKREG